MRPNPASRRRSPPIDRSRLRDVAELLVTHAPGDFGFVQPLWNRPAVRAVAAERVGVQLRDDRIWSSLARAGLTLRWPSARSLAWRDAQRRRREIREAGRKRNADVVLLTCQKLVLQTHGAMPRLMGTLNAVGPFSERRFLAFPGRVTRRTFAELLDSMAKTGRSRTWVIVDATVPVPRPRGDHFVLFDLSAPAREREEANTTVAEER